ncbi:nitrogen fixation protein NifQ [Roseomonas sp. NAR14]|uniref:Nitrogen fixation protein NifQ n=1 Tax=Roseomonas acroporae TaxID=2937791 RepID=A0A9X2BU29_9PROT|nr:nitrogen fixation protein NifQ [Roseomonas acroporae]MCK8784992.1 nitrogen fixation protein NifQ [Roseomonas acroporae]
MNATDVYAWLSGGSQRGACDGFDAHVLASVLAIGIAESANGHSPVTESVGLSGEALAGLAAEVFPHAAAVFARVRHETLAARPADEDCLRELLRRHSTEGSGFQSCLADVVARRCMRPNHLWQDLGLRSRRELSWLMARHFEPLASRNGKDMKWKKFLYRTICRDDGYRLCAAPICSECDDFEACFGEENGESLIARVHRDADPVAGAAMAAG